MNTEFDKTLDKTKEIAKDLSKTGQNIKDGVQEIGTALEDDTKNLGKEALHQANEWYECTVDYIKTNPCKAVGIAFLVRIVLTKWQK